MTVRNRILAGGGLRVAAGEGERSYLATITIPMRRVGTFSLQQVHTVHRHVTHAATGLSASVPLGPLQVFERFQWTDMVSRDHPLGLRTAGQQLQSVATYRPTHTVELDAASLPAHYAPGRGRQTSPSDLGHRSTSISMPSLSITFTVASTWTGMAISGSTVVRASPAWSCGSAIWRR